MAEVGPRLGDQQQADPSPPKGRGDLLLKSKLQMTEIQALTIRPHFHRQITPSWRSAKLAKLKVNTLNTKPKNPRQILNMKKSKKSKKRGLFLRKEWPRPGSRNNGYQISTLRFLPQSMGSESV